MKNIRTFFGNFDRKTYIEYGRKKRGGRIY